MLKAMEVHSNIKDGVPAVLIKLDVRTAIELAAYLLKQALRPGPTVSLIAWRSGNLSVLRAKKRA